MNLEPQKLFIGLVDFFSILLPGALLTYLLMDSAGPAVLGTPYTPPAGTQGWAAFLFVSYLLGHLIFLVGSWLDSIYDWLRCRTLNWQIGQVANRGRLLNWPTRLAVSLVFKRERNLAVGTVVKIKSRALNGVQGKDAINAFQWCKALLNVESPQSLAVVQRFEADSKFFRCFTVVLLVLLVAWPFQVRWPAAGIPVVLGLLLLAAWRYMEQRYKATNQAYWSVITLAARDNKIVIEKPARPAGAPTHAGGVVFRGSGRREKYLLVEAKNDPAQWVLPKGHIEEGEQPREAAVREVYEETGVWARIVDEPRDVSYSVNGVVITVRYFPMQAIGRGRRADKDRRHDWLPLAQAVARASYLETRDLLHSARVEQESLQAAERRRVRV